MAGHSLERAYHFLPALSTLDAVQLPRRVLLYPLADEAVVLVLDISEKVKPLTDRTYSLVMLYAQSELRKLTDVKVAQPSQGFFVI